MVRVPKRLPKMKTEDTLMIVIVVLIVLIVLYWLFTSMRRNVRESFECKDGNKNDVYTGTNSEQCFNKYELKDNKVIMKWIDSKGNRFSYKLKKEVTDNNTKYNFLWNGDSLLHTTDKPDEQKYIWSDGFYRVNPQPTTRAPTTPAPTTRAPTTRAPTTPAPTTTKSRTMNDYNNITAYFAGCEALPKYSKSKDSSISNLITYKCGNPIKEYTIDMNTCQLPITLKMCKPNTPNSYIQCNEKDC